MESTGAAPDAHDVVFRVHSEATQTVPRQSWQAVIEVGARPSGGGSCNLTVVATVGASTSLT